MIKRLHKRRGHQGSAKTCMYEWYTLYLCSVYVQCILPLGLWGSYHIPHSTLHIAHYNLGMIICKRTAGDGGEAFFWDAT